LLKFNDVKGKVNWNGYWKVTIVPQSWEGVGVEEQGCGCADAVVLLSSISRQIVTFLWVAQRGPEPVTEII
jgi:hypothetical protein